jgi:hypothetical protein
MRWPAKGLDTATLNPPAAKARFAFQYPRLLNYPREIRYRLFVDDRRRRFFRLQDFGQVAADQDCEDAGCHILSLRRSIWLAIPQKSNKSQCCNHRPYTQNIGA